MKLKLFELDPRTRLVDIDKEWISTIKEFRDILRRDKGSEGDSEGRKKLRATKEFTFIYHYCDYGSKFINYSEKDKLINCLRNAELSEKFDITEDGLLVKAIEVYKGLQETPSLKLLIELQEGIHTSYRVVRKVREKLEEKLDNIDLDEVEQVQMGNKTVTVDPVQRITTMLTSLIEIGNTLPKTLKTLQDLEKQVKLEMADESGTRGGYEKGAKEDAPVDIHNIGSKLMTRE